MDILIRLLIALEIIVCLMLIGIILIQKSKGRGLGLSFGGGAAETVFGGQMGNVLTRTTVILAVVFLVNTTLLAILRPGSAGKTESLVNKAIAQQAAAQTEEPAATPAADSGLLPVDADLPLPGLDIPELPPEGSAIEVPALDEAPAAPAVEPEAPADEPAAEAPAPAAEPAEPAAEAAAPAAEPAAPAAEPAAQEAPVAE